MRPTKRGRPAASTEVWHKNVTRPALDLHELMGQLTTVWGSGVGCFTLANWSFAVGIHVAYVLLDPEASTSVGRRDGSPGRHAGTWTAAQVVFMAA